MECGGLNEITAEEQAKLDAIVELESQNGPKVATGEEKHSHQNGWSSHLFPGP